MQAIGRLGVLILVIAAAAAAMCSRPALAAPAADEPCNPVGKLHFVCGALNAEDLVRVPGTDWIVASGMSGGSAKGHGSLHLINLRSKAVETVFPGANPQMHPDKATYGDCPGAPDPSKFEAHGLNLRPGGGAGDDTLYAVNHGGREAIEIFALNAKTAQPTLAWIGCAVMPPHAWPNSVAPLPDDSGMVVTDMFDPQDKQAPDKLAKGENTGAVYEWHPKTGFTRVPGSEMSGNNGIEVSRDGKWIYVAAWGNKAVVRLPRGDAGGQAQRQALPAGFLVDNLRWAPDGKLMVAGQNAPAQQVFSCFDSPAVRCTQPWRILKWDTGTMQLQQVASDNGDLGFGDATVGLQVGNEVFVGTFRGDRIAYFSLK